MSKKTFSDKYAKYGKSYDKQVELLEARAEEEKNKKNKKGTSVMSIMDKPILNITEFDKEYPVRFISSLNSDNWFFAEVHFHYIKHPTLKKSNGDPVTIVATCAEKFGKECFLCTEFKNLLNMVPGDTWQERSENKYKERTRKENAFYLAKKKYFSPVIYEGEIHVFGYGPMVKKKLESCYKDGRFGGQFNHPLEGFPVYVSKEKTGPENFNVDYSVNFSNKEQAPLAETEKEIDFLIEQAADVWEFVTESYQWTYNGTRYTNPQIKEILRGADKEVFRVANDEAFKVNGYVGLETGLGIEPDFAYEEELAQDSADPYARMEKVDLIEECKKRKIRASIKWTEEEYKDALRGSKLVESDIPY